MVAGAPTRTGRGWSQLRQPHGRAGAWVGRFLGVVNTELNRRAVARLAPRMEESVLEIGPGPGVGLALLARAVRSGHVAGIDPSDVMLAQAERRNRGALADGRLELRRGTAAALPWPEGAFDAVLSVNNVLLWSPWDASLAEVHRVLRPGGRAVFALHALAARMEAPPGAGSLPGVAEVLIAGAARAGFGGTGWEVVGLATGRALLLDLRRVRPLSG